MRALLLGLTAALGLLHALPAPAQDAPSPQQSSPFTDAEQEALHAEIRAYLLANPEMLHGDDPAPRREAEGGDRGE